MATSAQGEDLVKEDMQNTERPIADRAITHLHEQTN